MNEDYTSIKQRLADAYAVHQNDDTLAEAIAHEAARNLITVQEAFRMIEEILKEAA